MTMIDIFKQILKQEGISQSELARRMGISKQALSKLLKQDDLLVSTVIKVIRPLGYEFIIEKRRNNK